MVETWRWLVFGPTSETAEVGVQLLVATLLTLVFLPVLYVTWEGRREARAQPEPVPASAE